MSKKLYNPKSHAPALYIQCWLTQIPVKLLSHGAKLVYGRLSQWADTLGHAYRSAPQLAEELGMCVRSVREFQKELRDAGLIGTYQPQKGGSNHFEFYDHPWMHEPIKEQLVYKEDKYTPMQNPALPHAESCTTPMQNPASINKKEIKRNKNTPPNPQRIASDAVCESSFPQFWNLYPIHKSIKECERIWRKKNLDACADQIIEKLKLQIEKDDQWKRGYIINPVTYLKDERWTDEIKQSPDEIQAEAKRLKNEKMKAEAELKAEELTRISKQRWEDEQRKRQDMEMPRSNNVSPIGAKVSFKEMVYGKKNKDDLNANGTGMQKNIV